jgi:hypothetical protein
MAVKRKKTRARKVHRNASAEMRVYFQKHPKVKVPPVAKRFGVSDSVAYKARKEGLAATETASTKDQAAGEAVNYPWSRFTRAASRLSSRAQGTTGTPPEKVMASEEMRLYLDAHQIQKIGPSRAIAIAHLLLAQESEESES